MPDLSIKVGFRGPWIAENEKAKTRKNQGFMRVFCVAGAVGRGFIYESALLDDRKRSAFSTRRRTSRLQNSNPYCFALRREPPWCSSPTFPHKKIKGEEKSSPLILAGAVGLEPTTNGFGVAQKSRKPLKILAFCNTFQSIKMQNAML